MATVRKPPLLRMTLPEFLEWEPGDASVRAWQLIDGEPVATVPGTGAHGAIQGELAALPRNHLLERQSICRVATEPGIVPELRANRNDRVPDLAVTCAPPSRETVVPDPLPLVEILSPSNEAKTWSNVWTYASMPSVSEILVVHSARILAEILPRDPNGKWPDEPFLVEPDEVLMLESIGFQTPLKALYRTTWLASA